MHLTIKIGCATFYSDTSVLHDISQSCKPYSAPDIQTEAFGLPACAASPFQSGSFTCSVDAGASVNCPLVTSLCPHSNGTHTECVGHVLPSKVTLSDIDIARNSGLMPALLLTVTLVPLKESGDDYAPGSPDDLVVSFGALQGGLNALAAGSGGVVFPASSLACLSGGALILRTRPSSFHKFLGRWTDTNPPYLTPTAVSLALALGVRHLLVDLPSVDKEKDGGQLLSHRAWWELPPAGEPSPQPSRPLSTRTITELCSVGDDVVDGPYLLNLQVAPLDLDAAPSRPILHPLVLGT